MAHQIEGRIGFVQTSVKHTETVERPGLLGGVLDPAPVNVGVAVLGKSLAPGRGRPFMGETGSGGLGDLDEIAVDFFGTDRFRDIVRAKVAALYPSHEVERFTDHFYGMVQFWRKTESDKLGLSVDGGAAPAAEE